MMVNRKIDDWYDDAIPIESYSDKYRLPNGRTPRTHARLLRAFKKFKEPLQEQDVETHRKALQAPQIEWIIDEWYLAVRCKNCDAEFAFQRENDEFKPTWIISATEFVLTCPECRFSIPYEGRDILTVRARGKLFTNLNGVSPTGQKSALRLIIASM